jgi:hypothetical protein
MTDDRRDNDAGPDEDTTKPAGASKERQAALGERPKKRMPSPGEVRAAFRQPRMVTIRKPRSKRDGNG